MEKKVTLKKLLQVDSLVNKYTSDIDVDKRAVCAKLNQQVFYNWKKNTECKKKKIEENAHWWWRAHPCGVQRFLPFIPLPPSLPLNNKVFRKAICTSAQTAKFNMKLFQGYRNKNMFSIHLVFNSFSFCRTN